MAGVAQADCATRFASGCPSGDHARCRTRTVQRHPSCGTGIPGRINSGRRSRAGEIERRIAAFAREPNGGLIVTASPRSDLQRDLVIKLASRNQLPAAYPFRYFVTGGGLISYGPDWVDQYRRAASYVDRILKGTKPADLPVQAPTKYELAINLKTAKTLGLTIPETLLATADEVIQ
jgi:putative ABC transport system substrate-binding protein